MSKRLKLQCWSCPKTYLEKVEITDQQEIIVRCPYCKAEAMVNLRPYLKKTITIMRGDNKDQLNEGELQLPDVLPTRERQ